MMPVTCQPTSMKLFCARSYGFAYVCLVSCVVRVALDCYVWFADRTWKIIRAATIGHLQLSLKGCHGWWRQQVTFLVCSSWPTSISHTYAKRDIVSGSRFHPARFKCYSKQTSTRFLVKPIFIFLFISLATWAMGTATAIKQKQKKKTYVNNTRLHRIGSGVAGNLPAIYMQHWRPMLSTW